MAKEFFDGARVGAMEAKWSARNAFTGKRESVNLRSQHLADKSAEHNAYTPDQLKNQQVLQAIEAKFGRAEQANASVAEQAQATAQIQAEAAKLLQNAPGELLLLPIGLALWLVARLPIKGIYKTVALTTILSIVISACATAAGTQTAEIPNQSAPVATETAGVPTQAATETAAPTATEVVLTLDQQIDAFMNGSMEFPTGMSQEEYKNFIEGMNERRGSKPIWVEGVDDTGAKVVLYYDVAKGEMVQLKGTYAENKAVIEQNTWNQYVELSSDAEGNLQYVDPNTGELVNLPGSAGMDWNKVIDNTNFDSAPIDWPTGVSRYGATAEQQFEFSVTGSTIVNGIESKLNDMRTRANIVLGVVIDNSPFQFASQQGRWNRYGCLEVIFVRTDADGNPTYGVRTFVGPNGSIIIGEEGMPVDLTGEVLLGQNELGDIQSGIYYIALAPDQQAAWEVENLADIDALQNTTSEKKAYDAALNDSTPDENIVLTSRFMIKKK